MKIFRYNFLFAVLISLTVLVKGQSAVQRVEGLLYTDQSPVSIEINEGVIVKISRIKELQGGNKNIYIAPGFIDNQVNGYASVSFAFAGGGLTVEGVKKATRALWEAGVTTYLPTLTTNSHGVLVNNFAILAIAKTDAGLHGSIAGFHLEGPYISPEDGYRGAHPVKFVRKPDWNEFTELYEASGRNILQVTIAPETEGAMDFISRCREIGIVVALGHHNASAEIITEAIDRGAKIATHLGNGCANMINRHINPIWPQLSDDRLMISIIGDGFHLRPEEIRVFYKVKGPDMTIITSDVTSYAAMPPGTYVTPEGETIELTPEGMLRYPSQDVLYGSASPVTKGIGNVMKVTGCSLEQAIQMASTNPARLYGLTDRGEIKTGMRADLVLFTLDDYNIKIVKSIVEGLTVYETGK